MIDEFKIKANDTKDDPKHPLCSTEADFSAEDIAAAALKKQNSHPRDVFEIPSRLQR